MRRVATGLIILTLLLAACAEEDTPTSGNGGGSGSAAGCDTSNPPLMEDGVLTVATDRPAFPPWFEGNPKRYSGYEGALATAVAKGLGVPVKWVVEPFNKSFAPGAKDYDFDINQISITPERRQAVAFSDGYFDNNQGLLAAKDSTITEADSVADLKDAQLGTQVGTTSFGFINSVIQPTSEPKIFDTTNDVKSALESGQLDGLVTDVVTTVYLRDFEIPGSVVVGQYPTNEQFGMVFEKGSPLVDCVNQVLSDLKKDGTLKKLQDKWLQDYLGVPILKD
ncbi:MAG: amino acid ABC transporter substrate-binding protein [Actinobacteria bacterium]|nr:amino acid ABC transporter substrate-binding protein [Actinomycetota bacterium]